MTDLQEAIKVLNTLPDVPVDYSTLSQKLRDVFKDINEHQNEKRDYEPKSKCRKWEKASSHKFRR